MEILSSLFNVYAYFLLSRYLSHIYMHICCCCYYFHTRNIHSALLPAQQCYMRGKTEMSSLYLYSIRVRFFRFISALAEWFDWLPVPYDKHFFIAKLLDLCEKKIKKIYELLWIDLWIVKLYWWAMRDCFTEQDRKNEWKRERESNIS
jgi:hypothetical protein